MHGRRVRPTVMVLAGSIIFGTLMMFAGGRPAPVEPIESEAPVSNQPPPAPTDPAGEAATQSTAAPVADAGDGATDSHGGSDADATVASDGPANGAPGSGGAAGTRYRAGEDPDFAARMGWPVAMPDPLPGAILPHRRIVAYYGNPLSRRMGVLGEYEPEEMLRRLDGEVAAWNAADPTAPVIPALHLVAVVAQADPGPTGKYRTRMRDSLVEQVSRWADTREALVFLDVQVGLGTLQEELPRLEPFLSRANFHLGIDPEFSMKDGTPPGRRIGTFDAEDINYAIDVLADIVERYDLPPKVLVVHRFTSRMVTNADRIKLDPRVQVVMHMDGWGAPWLKRDSYRDFIVREPVQFTGFKIFYHNDTKAGDPLMLPADLLRLRPVPLYIQYQ
jgi:hypothetical protein